jgi:hypothetical protein
MISFLGVIGTILGFILINVFIVLINRYVFSDALTLKEVMMLSAVLCATDTVAAMSLIKVNPTLLPALKVSSPQRGLVWRRNHKRCCSNCPLSHCRGARARLIQRNHVSFL